MHIIGGKYKKKALLSPKNEEVRPTSGRLRETVFNLCQMQVTGALFLDLFAGAGAMGLEALSRGANHATFVEKSRSAAKLIRENIAHLKETDHTKVIVADAFNTLQHFADTGQKFDLIFADPPYGLGLGEKTIEDVDRLGLLSAEGELYIEDEESAEDLITHPTHLHLKSSRKVGRTWLRQFILKH